MNLYLLVEGSRTEKEVYPRWLSILVPALTQVYDPFGVESDNFYVFSSNGYPGIKGDIHASVLDINKAGNYDYFLICLDSDDSGTEEKREEIELAVHSLNISLSAKLAVIVQCKCIETWFLGNRKKYPYNIGGEFFPYGKFYNVLKNNPEAMEKPRWFTGSASQFHALYLKKMLAWHGGRYTKKNPYSVCSKFYVDELQKRINNTMHLRSLKYFFDLCNTLKG